MKKDMKNQDSKNTKKDADIRPLADRVLIKEIREDKETMTKSGIIIPISAGSDDKGGKRGLVIAIGEGRYEDGKLVSLSVKVGDKVLFQWGDKVKSGDEEYYIVREAEILAIVK